MAKRATKTGDAPKAVDPTKPEGRARIGSGGRRLSARPMLIAAAYRVMSRKGLEGSTIAEIIEEAGVGVGSFYNHFSSKEELAQAVFTSRAEEFGATLEQVVRHVANAAAATCFAYRRLIEEAERDKVWASFIVQLEPSMQMLDRLLRKYARVGMKIGIDSGNFDVPSAETAITTVHALEIAMVKLMLDGSITHKEAHGTSLYALRALGVAEDEAQRLSSLSMAALRRELRESQKVNEPAGAQAPSE